MNIIGTSWHNGQNTLLLAGKRHRGKWHISLEDCLVCPVKASAVYKEVYPECVISIHLAQINRLVSLYSGTP